MHWICPFLQQSFVQVKIKAGACGAFVGLIVKMLSRKHLWMSLLPRVGFRHPQTDPGEQGEAGAGCRGSELSRQLGGHVLPFSGADPALSTSTLVPWVVVTATASALNPIWVQEQVTKWQKLKGGHFPEHCTARKHSWHMEPWLLC